ncbi:hypothetical protein PABG_01111 [Paracoccidioides brasiliensis Pb03]|nr:hypothetical protein PABG_01111 [Paracoccidioides brasiliensis Pb03]
MHSYPGSSRYQNGNTEEQIKLATMQDFLFKKEYASHDIWSYYHEDDPTQVAMPSQNPNWTQTGRLAIMQWNDRSQSSKVNLGRFHASPML